MYNALMRVMGYLRVSTADQADSGAGLAAQREAIQRECSHRGWELVNVYQDVASGKSLNGRAQLRAALAELHASNAEVLMSSKLDRLSRSAVDFGNLLDLARREGWKVVVLDLGVDTSTSVGELIAGVLVQVAQFERRRLSERTSEALRQKQKAGVRLGRPRRIAPQTEAWIHWRRRQGATLREIAAELNDQGSSSPNGGSWQHSTVQRVLGRAS